VRDLLYGSFQEKQQIFGCQIYRFSWGWVLCRRIATTTTSFVLSQGTRRVALALHNLSVNWNRK